MHRVDDSCRTDALVRIGRCRGSLGRCWGSLGRRWGSLGSLTSEVRLNEAQAVVGRGEKEGGREAVPVATHAHQGRAAATLALRPRPPSAQRIY
eukprot:1177261-Prorocentrum_minimum.AAC.1